MLVVQPYFTMKLKLTFFVLFSAFGFASFAQDAGKASLETVAAPPAMVQTSPDSSKTQPSETKTLAQLPKKVGFSLSAGTMVSNYGMASYLAPSMYYRLNSKFSLFTGVTYINSNFSPYRTDGLQPMATKHYLMNVGGTYHVSDKLLLSGSVWRDFSNLAGNFNERTNLRQPARYGTEFNATYKVNDVLTIHGGIRTSTGGNPYNQGYNSFYNPGMPYGY